ncbi:MAG: glucoamylase family protein [Rhodothermales bacterium]
MSEPVENPFDLEALAAYARRMARTQAVVVEPRRLTRPPLFLLREAYRGLPEAYRALSRAAKKRQSLTPAAHWLLDNFHLIREQANQVREGLPWSYYRVLPRLESGPDRGRPRVFEVVRALAQHTDNALGDRQLAPFIWAYQEVSPFLLSELWALPSALRLVLLQNLSALAQQVVTDLEDRAAAATWARRIAEHTEGDSADVVTVLAGLAERHAPLSDAFIVTLSTALQGQGAAAAPALDWIERRLHARGSTLDTVIHRETQRQSHRQFSVANAVTSLREVDRTDWPDLVESLSVVDKALRRDPAGVYEAMDFLTRDRYRHRVEDLSRYAGTPELGVAERALLLAADAAHATASEAATPTTAEPVGHVGYWLAGPGAAELETEMRYRPPLGQRLRRWARAHPNITYFGLVTGWAAVLYAVLVLLLDMMTAPPLGLVVLAFAVSFLPVLDLSVALTNWLLTRVMPPDILPKLAFEEGLPDASRTFVVVPTLIDSPESAQRQAERLEVHALANPDPNLRFGLLTDFPDAPAQHAPGDAATLAAARETVAALNRRYRDDAGDKFFLLHRERRWNAVEGVWMGWERKRGKLEEFIRLLREPDASTTYTEIEGDFRAVAAGDAFRYVLTLDADTELPPEGAAALVRTAAHPLNRPRYNATRTRVEHGYGVFQPRIGIGSEAGHRTGFARVFAGFAGIDPYTTAVSDVYQDLFGEGIFTGKGLLDIDAFRTVLEGVLPENKILSHDLLEGLHARAALVTDVVLFDDYPSHYAAFAKRLHRWVRGDWQILPWLFPAVPGPDGRWRRNPARLRGRWKVFDNLRRSLTPPSVLVFLLLGWTVLPGSPFVWTALALGVLAFPIYAPFTSALLAHPRDVVWRSYLQGALTDARRSTVQVGLSVVFLAHEAYVMTDAIVRTLWRMFVSRRRLLEWVTAQQAEQRSGRAPGLWFSVLWGGLVLIVLSFVNPLAWVVALPFVAAWVAAPWVADAISRPVKETAYVLSDAERARLRLVARRTWRYFDAFVGPADRWLAPDNFQEQPFRGVARRTSPTNLGLALLAAQAAHDFGYLSRSALLDRLAHQLSAIDELERHAGHLYNWYSTETGAPLHPRYVSSVDSGNLAAALVALREGLRETPDAAWPSPGLADALADALAALDEVIARPRADVTGESTRLVVAAARSLRGSLPAAFSADLPTRYEQLLALDHDAEVLRDAATDLAIRSSADREEFLYWASQPFLRLRAEREELERFAPWLMLDADAPPDRFAAPGSLGGLRAHTQAALRHNGQPGPLHDALVAADEALTFALDRAEQLAIDAERLALGMDFGMLYRKGVGLFAIGYDVDRAALDAHDYGLLASEARLASLLAIAKGDVPVEHWFRMGRPTAAPDGHKVLLSWSGTMFEYLMPVLLTRLFPGSLLEESARNAVAVQRAYGQRHGHPWGISESAYFKLDPELTYQYRAFGVPGLGLDRGLHKHYVAAPYATLLALPIAPEAALANLTALAELGAYGPYGYYEAVDFTPHRVPPGKDRAVVRAYMVHHQGMGLLALANTVLGDAMQHRFHASPLVRSVEVLLQERVPREIEKIAVAEEMEEIEPIDARPVRPAVRHVPAERLRDEVAHGALLSNGDYSTFVTAAGSGYSRHGGDAVTRWTPDRTREHDGLFLYVRDADSGRTWSAAAQPIAGTPDRYEAWLHTNKVEIARVDDWIETFSEVCVSPEDDVELRRYTLTNYGDRPRRLELTSYAEVALNDADADHAHPAFSKLFVQTEYVPTHHALLAWRRPRSDEEPHRWLFHTIADDELDAATGPLQIETDRARFLGRGRSTADPAALDPGASLSGSLGPVLDPIVSLRRVVEVPPKGKVTVTFALGVADSRAEALRLADRYDHPEAARRAFDLATVYGLVELQHLGLQGNDALYAQGLASALLYAPPSLRADTATVAANRRSQPGLWAYGISGDLPLIVLRVSKTEHMETVRRFLQAHAYLRAKGLHADLLVLNEHPPSYADELQKAILDAVQASPGRNLLNERGGLFVRRADGLPEEDLTLILAVARVVVDGTAPELALDGPPPVPPPPIRARPAAPDDLADEDSVPDDRAPLQFFNGYGGFTEDGSEYVIRLGGEGEPAITPLPWTNVVANPDVGFTATESGTGATWAGNSQMNKLTPWSNDPIADPAEETLYLRDEDAGIYWSPTPRPVPAPGGYEVRHGWGYSTYRHASRELEQETTLFVPLDAPVKLVRLRVTNRSAEPRRLSAFRYHAWVLADQRRKGALHTVVEGSEDDTVLFATNRFNAPFADRVAFSAVIAPGAAGITATADRTAFLGRGGSPERPFALERTEALDGHAGAGLDPCAAFQVPLDLAPGETAAVLFLLGQTGSRDEAESLLARFRDGDAAEAALAEVRDFWRETLTAVQIETPVPALDVLANGWLLYQNLACRLWGRTAFYQSGGAFGFRDQIQDSAALVYTRPDITRAQILLHAAHQFVEGDVLHWWHPETQAGIRTRFSDDLLWLPYITASYVRTTGDTAVLDEEIRFLTARALEEGEDEVYLTPTPAGSGSLYEHGCRALDISLTKGPHGLPLMGSGDWNDGMNRVGNDGRGESVWLGFFLRHILRLWIPLSEARGDDERVAAYRAYDAHLADALNDTGWDGDWYRRAYYDDGAPLGSSESDECRIDAIAQGWAVMSGTASPQRAERALASAEAHLVDRDAGIVKLLAPPFDTTPHDPGYIKGYVPGVRENGGQYTHGILWLLRALAETGRGDTAADLLEMISPVTRTATPERVAVYQTEPYAVAADVYGVEPHTGRGGWTWYTGSAGWFYRVIVESLLGFRIEGGDTLVLTPRIPASWPGFTFRYRHGDAVYTLTVAPTDDDTLHGDVDGEALTSDGETVRLPLRADGHAHAVALHVPRTMQPADS